MESYPESQSEPLAQSVGRESVTRIVGHEWPLLLSILTTVLFLVFSKKWFSGLSDRTTW